MNLHYKILPCLLVGTAILWAQPEAVAQQSASAKAALEEIIVTARRREEKLMTLPFSVQAITADAMAAQGILNVQEAADYIPNVNLTQNGRANHTVVIVRGIGGSSPDPSTIYGSALYIDGHYVPGRQSGFSSTLDIERIEVLRGPQGTLFGKNVTGGLVNIITARPKDEFESSVTVRFAEDGQQDIRGMINVPFSEKLIGRLAIAKETMDGYYYNRHLDKTVGATDVTAINAALRFKPTDNWVFDLSYNRQDRQDDQNPRQCNPFDGSASRFAGGINGQIEPGLGDLFIAACADDSASGNVYVTSSDHVGFSDTLVESSFISGEWTSDGAFGPLQGASLKLKASVQETDYDHYYDRDSTFYDIGEMGVATWSAGCADKCGQDMYTRGFEAIFEAQVNDKLHFTVGANSFFENSTNGDGDCRDRFLAAGAGDLDPDNPSVTGPAGGQVPNPLNPDLTNGVDCSDIPSGLIVAPHVGGSNPFIIQNEGRTDSIGVFAHITYAFNDNWTLDVGSRWTEDERKWWNFEGAINNCDSDTPQSARALGVTSGPEEICTFGYTPTFQSVVLDGLFNNLEGTWDDVTSSISLSRNLAGGDVIDDGMVYFLISEGFLSGGFNTEINVNLLTLAGGGDDVLFYGPESMTNYEIGFKGTLFDGRLKIAADVFYMDYQDKQENIEIANAGGLFGPDDGNAAVTSNVASVDISGIELELRATPWEGGFISVDYGYLKNEYSSFQYPDPENPGSVVDLEGDVIADLIPKWTLNIGIEHQFTLGNGATITPRANFYSEPAYDFSPTTLGAEASLCEQDAYTKVNVRASYVPAEGSWKATVFGNNITDEEIYTNCGAGGGGYGTFHYHHERPATWGAEFTYNWGG